MLDDDQGVASLFKNGHELSDYECSADFQVLEPAVQSAEDGSLGKHPILGYQGVEALRPQGNSGLNLKSVLKAGGREDQD
ncbi:MAG: hypothetical protein ABR985_13910 [Methanotrichaceae archaeon]